MLMPTHRTNRDAGDPLYINETGQTHTVKRHREVLPPEGDLL
jgi:hypothetical protein